MSIELWRVVQDQESYYEKVPGLDYEEAEELNVLLEKSKPYLNNESEEWDELIYTPFRYPLPVGINFGSRFKAPMSNYNLLYASLEKNTSFAESAHHMIAEREHLTNLKDETIKKMSFSLSLSTTDNINDVSQSREIKKIMSDNYAKSHSYATKIIKTIDGFKYPSARIEGGTNFAIKEIITLEKKTRNKESVAFKFFADKRRIEVNVYLGEKLFEYTKQNVFFK